MKIKFIITCALFLIAQSCTYRINSLKYTPGTSIKKNDLFYHLTKTCLMLSVTYQITERTQYIHGVAEEPETSYLVTSAALKSISINDPDELYIARGKNISHKFFLKENIDFTFNDKGVIQSVETNFEDTSTTSLENLLKGVGALIETTTIAGPAQDAYLLNLQKKIGEAYNNQLKAIETGNTKDIARYQAQLKSYLDLLASFKEQNKVVIKHTEKTISYFIDPDKTAEVDHKKKITIQMAPKLPPVVVTIHMLSDKVNSDFVLTTGVTKNNTLLMPGLLYTIPASLLTVVSAPTTFSENQSLVEESIAYPQYGNLGLVPVTSKLFTNRKTTLKFDSATGTLTSYDTESGSSSESLSKTVASLAEQLQTTVTDLKYTNKIDALKKEKELKDLQESLKSKGISKTDSLNTALEILKLQLELKKVQQEIEGLNKK